MPSDCSTASSGITPAWRRLSWWTSEKIDHWWGRLFVRSSSEVICSGTIAKSFEHLHKDRASLVSPAISQTKYPTSNLLIMGSKPRYLTGDKEGIKEFLDKYDVCIAPASSQHLRLP